MSEPKKSFIRRTGSFLLGYLTPWRSISRSADSVKNSLENIGDAARQARESMRADHERIQAAKQVQLTPEQRRMTPGELFQHYFEIYGWTEEGLARNRSLYWQAKWACYTVAAVATIAALWMIVAVGSQLLSFFVAPTLLICSLIIVSRGALEARKQAQVELRAVFSFKQFMSRPDFFKRLVA